MLSTKLYIPKNLEKDKEVEEAIKLLNNLNIRFEKRILVKEEGTAVKFEYLLPIAVARRLKIKQTQKSKVLYPTFVIFKDNKPITFYPQSRASESISIIDFLKGLKNKQILCLDGDCKEALKDLISQAETYKIIKNLNPLNIPDAFLDKIRNL